MTLNKLELMQLIVTINRDIFKLRKEACENANLSKDAQIGIGSLTKLLEIANVELAKD